MDKLIDNYAIFLDELRIKYNLTEENFCEGICNPRTYRRYLSGDRDLPHAKIAEFTRKLGISLNDFFYSIGEHDRIEFQKINHIYKLLTDKKYQELYEQAAKINPAHIVNDRNRKYLEFCVIKADFRTKKRNVQAILDDVSHLIDYPKCLEHRAFDFIDLISLSLIMVIEVDFKIETALNKLKDIMMDHSYRYLSSETRYILPSLFGNVGLMLYKLDRIEECKALAETGLQMSNLYQDDSQLGLLHYLHALTLLKLGYAKEAEKAAIKSLMSVILKGSEKQIEMYHNELQAEFGYDPLNEILKYKDELLKGQ